MIHRLALPFLVSLAFPSWMTAQGTGLAGQYHDTATFGTLKTTRTDATVDFNWGTAIPSGTAITHADTFSVAWSGQVEPEFSQLYTFYVTADDGARLWVNDQLVVTRTFAAAPAEMRGQVNLKAGQRVNIRLEYIEQTGNASVRLEWSCASRAREVIPTPRLYPARVDKAGGSLLKEHWSGIAGGLISSLTSDANYPNKPGGREFIASFECLAQDWADSYGTRVTGYIVPPVTGSYTFAVSGDDVVELYLSTDATSANRALIANVTSPTGFRVWNAQPAQQSTPRTLTQGQRYYVELLHKEDAGADHWSVGWMQPGDSAFSVVPGGVLLQPGLTTAQPAETSLLNTLTQEHPRIFSTAERFAKLRATWQSGTTSQPKTWAQNAINSADGILAAAPVAYTQDVRGTILSQSRTVVDRMYKLGVAWQLTGGSQYAERAWMELSAVAAFPDWHPAHFLDTAEMTHACAIGYDWFYNYWTQPRRDTIRNAIINFGLNAGLSQYTSNAGWSRSTGNNWNMVCNGGMTIGALAVGAESESLAENILNRALNSTRPVWRHFTTDNGAWYEGPGYWGYTTEYGIRMFAALESVLGSDFGISGTQDVSEAGFAPIHALGTSNIIFNFADAGAGGAGRGPVFQWFARRYGQPLFAWWENQGSGGALDALWWNDNATSPTSAGAQPDMAFHGETGTAFNPQEMVTMRGRWNDSRAAFVGCKGGQMGADHGNLDAGTFVFDALGKRWFHDLGGDDYALPGYFSSAPSAGTDRWDYYRLRPEGQNTLTVNPSANADMVLNAVAPLIAFQSEPGGTGSFAIHDLTPVYSGMTRVWRGTRLIGARNQLLVQDEIQAASGTNVWWFAHYTNPATTVIIDPDGSSAMMTQGAERLWCKILSGGGTFQVMDAVPLPTSPSPAGQNANTGYKKLAIHLTGVTDTTLAVWFVPLSAGDAVPVTLPAVAPLSSWNLAASNDAPVAGGGNASSVEDNAVDIDLRNYITDDSTPPEEMRFSVSNPVNGTVILLADGHTARFTPATGYTGVPAFNFTATDTTPDPRMLFAYDFDPPDASAATVVPDVSGNRRDGTNDFAGTGVASIVTDQPASLGGQGGRSIDLVEDGTNAARVQRLVSTGELNFNTQDWTITGWFKRRDLGNDDFVVHLSNGDGFGSNDELYLNCPSGQATARLQHFNAAGGANDVDITKSGVAEGTWHHFAIVRGGTTLSLYIDGALAGSNSSFTLALLQTSPVVFGGHSDPTFQPGRWFDGRLDDCAVLTAALSAAEIATLAGGMTVRHFGGLSATGTITLSATPTTYVWTNATTGSALNWSDGANWSGSIPPASSRGAALQFFNGQTLTGGTIASNNNVASPFLANTLTLAGTSTTATNTTLTGNALQLLNNGTAAPAVNLSASGSTTTYDVQMPLTFAAATTFNATASGTFIFSGNIDGPGGLTRSGTSGKLILAGANTYTGDTIINSGTLQIGNDGATGSPGSGDIIDNGQLRFDRTGTLEVPNSIGGTGTLYVDCPIDGGTKVALGTVVLSGTNTFDGGVTVNSGALRITNSTALGDGVKTITLSNGTNGAPQLILDGSADPIELPAGINFSTSNDSTGAIVNAAGNNIISGSITLTGGGGSTRIYTNAGTLTLDGSIVPNTTSRTLRLCGAGSGVVNGTIGNGSDTHVLTGLNKVDAGTWTLSGNNTHSGTTTVSAGTLVIANAGALGNGGSQFGNTNGSTSVSSGATLDLNGQSGINEVITIRGTGVGGNGCLVNTSPTTAGIAGGVISSISTTAGGVHSTVPGVTISGGGGSGATATATLGVGAASFTINGGTTVYSVAPTVTISGGGGTGATATAVLTGGVVSGITITSAGTGFTTAPAIAFSGGTVATAGTNPTGTGNAANFVVAGIQVMNPGSGYTSAPAVGFSSGTGTAATANLSTVILGAATTIGGTGDIIVDANVSGAFALTKAGAGTLTLNGANTHTGLTVINGGRLILSGSLAGGLQTNNGFAFAPHGTPNVAGAFTHFSSSILQIRLNGTSPGSGHDQLNAGGTVTLAGQIELLCSPNLPPGSTFTIINKASTGAISGTFTGKPENSTFVSADGYTFRVNYGAGTGNDVVLTLVASPIEQWRFANFGSMLDTGSGSDTADTDSDGATNLLEYATKMDPAAGDTVPQSATRNGGVIDFVYTRNKSATDVTFIVEWSDTLANDWSTSGVGAPVILADNGVTQQIKVTVPAGAGVTRRFVHLKVTRP